MEYQSNLKWYSYIRFIYIVAVNTLGSFPITERNWLRMIFYLQDLDQNKSYLISTVPITHFPILYNLPAFILEITPLPFDKPNPRDILSKIESIADWYIEHPECNICVYYRKKSWPTIHDGTNILIMDFINLYMNNLSEYVTPMETSLNNWYTCKRSTVLGENLFNLWIASKNIQKSLPFHTCHENRRTVWKVFTKQARAFTEKI